VILISAEQAWLLNPMGNPGKPHRSCPTFIPHVVQVYLEVFNKSAKSQAPELLPGRQVTYSFYCPPTERETTLPSTNDMRATFVFLALVQSVAIIAAPAKLAERDLYWEGPDEGVRYLT